MKFILATGNESKIREIKDVFEENHVIMSLKDINIIFPDLYNPEETGETYVENAYIKALTARELILKYYPTEFEDYIIVGDDSGIEIEFYSRGPGILTHRWTGDSSYIEKINEVVHEIDQGLKNYESYGKVRRYMNFSCSMVAMNISKEKYKTYNPAHHTLDGLVATEDQLTSYPYRDDAVAYDPLLYLTEYGKTCAQMNIDDVYEVSHRINAFRKLIKIIQKENK